MQFVYVLFASTHAMVWYNSISDLVAHLDQLVQAYMADLFKGEML